MANGDKPPGQNVVVQVVGFLSGLQEAAAVLIRCHNDTEAQSAYDRVVAAIRKIAEDYNH